MKIWLRTFGCRANQYDSEQVRAMLVADGHEIVDEVSAADAAVVNSCAVTSDAVADARQAVRRAARERPSVRTIVMGCAAELSPGAGEAGSFHDLPGVMAIVGGADVVGVAAALGVRRTPALATIQTGTRALLRIQDGCDEHCTFCATTQARGDARSRAAQAIVDEARALAESHREIVLTGVHIGAYGADTGDTLSKLVERLIIEVPHARFRLSSLEATEVDERMRELLRSEPMHLAPYLHAPLQSGSDRLLRRMGRHWYDADRYARAIEEITDGVGIFGLGADVISGFPGETEEDHAATVRLVERLPFTSLHVFPYSERPGTPAARLGSRIGGDEARARAAELREVARVKANAYMHLRSGTEGDVLVLSGRREGLTEDYLSVGLATPAARGSRLRMRLTMGDGRLVAAPLNSGID
jgi:threonylcarbamoyladenosine tRNA methylthiotransferase MtaB